MNHKCILTPLPPNETNTFSSSPFYPVCILSTGGKWENTRHKNLFCSNLHVPVRPSMPTQTSRYQEYGMQREWRVWILQYIQIAARNCWEHLIPDSPAVLHIHLIEMCAYIPNEQFPLISKKLSLWFPHKVRGLTANFSPFSIMLTRLYNGNSHFFSFSFFSSICPSHLCSISIQQV